MAEKKIGAVKRAGAFSPNHIGNDTAILNMVADQLRKRGYEVNMYTEEDLAQGKVTEDVVVNMCRETTSIEILKRMEEDGRLVINSGFGIENCIKERMTRLLMGHNMPYPESLIVETDHMVRDQLKNAGFSRCWIKRGEFHSQHKEDVSYVRHAEEAQEVLQEYFLRGIRRAVINKHIEGETIKFYGCLGIPFFYWFYTSDRITAEDSADGAAQKSPKPDLDVKKMIDTCREIAEILDVRIFGGDIIVEEDGSFKVIDFNDWPSFAPCRPEAAKNIAKSIVAAIKEYKANNNKK